MQSVELASFASRLAGRISANLALGTTVHNTMYVGSRFFLVPFLPILAYLVETGITINNYLIIVITSLGSVLIMSLIVDKASSLDKVFPFSFAALINI
jgi:hypothetical protein